MTNRQLFLRHVAQTSDAPLLLEVARAEGVFLYDPDGRRYFDLIAGIGPNSLGHRHPHIEKAVREQLGKYWHTIVYGEYVLSPQVRLAKLLTEHLPVVLDSVFYVNSGSEAVEGAMKLAKRHTGRPEIVACRNAYHGSTHGAASLMSPTFFTQPYHPLVPGIRHIEFNAEEDLQFITEQTAAVIIEPVQAEAGMRLAANGYLQKLRERCTETGALLILDEVQTGFGRTGTLFAFEQYGIVPDVLCLAKAMGGGMPLGAFIAHQNLMSDLSHDPPLGHITTYGGHPVCCAASLAALEILTTTDLLTQVEKKAELFKKLLKHPKIKELRNAGLLMSLDIGDAAAVQKIVRNCLENGVVVDWFLFNNECIRVAPPLVISEAEIEEVCGLVFKALDASI